MKREEETDEKVFMSFDEICLIRILNKFNVHRLDTELFNKANKEKRIKVDYDKDTLKLKINVNYLKKFLKMLDEDEDCLIIYTKQDCPIKLRTNRKVCYIAPRLDYDIIKTEGEINE